MKTIMILLLTASLHAQVILGVEYFDTHSEVLFTCEENTRYVAYSNQEGTWIHEKTFTPEVENGIGSINLPIRDQYHITESINQDTVDVGIISFDLFDTYASLTFESNEGVEYVVQASSDLKIWTPSDLLKDGVIDRNSTSVIGEDGETTVLLPRPFLPWCEDCGFLRVETRKLPTVPNAALAPSDKWLLVCTRDGDQDPFLNTVDVGVVGVAGSLTVMSFADGPTLTWAGKYMHVEGKGRVVLKGNLVRNEDFIWPAEPIKQFVVLEKYVGPTPPKVLYHPSPHRANRKSGYLEYEYRIQDGSSIVVATYKPESLLKDSIGMKPLGIGFEISIPPNEGNAMIQQNWGFAAMNDWMLEAFKKIHEER